MSASNKTKKGRPYNTASDFWDRVNKEGECWEWTLSCSPSGYGKATWKNKTWRSHRLAYYLTYGEVPRLVMHRCDNRKCCNPHHLISGTHKKNMKDMAIKKRAARQSGTQHGQSKYTEKQIKQIRDEYKNGKSITELSLQNKIHREYIRQIVLRKRWRHI